MNFEKYYRSFKMSGIIVAGVRLNNAKRGPGPVTSISVNGNRQNSGQLQVLLSLFVEIEFFQGPT